ncbi:hypothetical protein VNO80_17382 [Phaseolus coccineus]|uniref:Lon proteolytic domain-containing protein n=1 Tax=Phaseolus coccineus TaxID=3886 RepID=A0AAN9MIF9_PHACN
MRDVILLPMIEITLSKDTCFCDLPDQALYITRRKYIRIKPGVVPKDGPSAGVTMVTTLVHFSVRKE